MPPRLRSVPHSADSPFLHVTPIRRNRRPRAHSSLDTGSCQHTNECACGSSRKPSDLAVASSAITDRFLMTSLDVAKPQLDILLCTAMAFKECVFEALQTPPASIEIRLSDRNTWAFVHPTVDATTETAGHIDLLPDVANRMFQRGILQSSPQSCEDMFSARDAAARSWKPVCALAIDPAKAHIDTTTYEGKQFLCTFIAPGVMHLLHHGEHALWAHVMAIPAPLRSYLLYQISKARISAKRRKEWKELLADRIVKMLLARVNAPLMQVNGCTAIENQDAAIAALVQRQKRDRDEMEALKARQESLERLQEMDRRAVVDVRDQQDKDRGAIMDLIAHQESDRRALSDLMSQQDEDRGALMDLRAQQNKDRGALTELTAHQENDRRALTDLRAQQDLDRAAIMDLTAQQESDHRAITAQQDLDRDSVRKALLSHSHQMDDLHEHLKGAVNSFTTVLEQKLKIDRPATLLPTGRATALQYLRLHSCSAAGESAIPDPDAYRRVWTAAEENRIVSRAVTASLGPSYPFLIVLLGYSGGGKSHTAFGRDGLLAGILERLPRNTTLQATEVLERTRSLGSFLGSADPEETSAAITRARTSAATAANAASSRAHLVLRFEDPETDTPYGLLLDIAGPERTQHMQQLLPDMARDSARIGNDNVAMQRLLQIVAVPGADLTLVKRASRVNTLVVAFVNDVAVPPVVRLVLCGDGSSSTMVAKTLGLAPGFE